MGNKMQKLFKIINTACILIRYGPRITMPLKNYFALGDIYLNKNGKIRLGTGNNFEKGYELESSGQMTMGDFNNFNRRVKIVCRGSIQIGNNCMIADSVHFYDHDHKSDDLHRLMNVQGFVTKPIKVGNNVWIGAKATILKGVTVGDGAIIGANAVVTKDVPANGIAVGNPAKVVKMRGQD